MEENDSFLRYQNAVIIAPEELHDSYLRIKEDHPELSFALYTLEEAEAMFAYRYDRRAVLFLLKEGHSYEKILAELPFLSRLDPAKEYLSEKLCALKGIQKKLISLNYFYKDAYPERSFENKPILIAGYADGFRLSRFLGELHNMAIGYELSEECHPLESFASFPDIYEELHYVFNLIAADLQGGTPIDDIYLYGADPSYDPLLLQFSALYGFGVEIKEAPRLFDTAVYHAFRTAYSSQGLAGALTTIETAYPQSLDLDSIYEFGKGFAWVFDDPLIQLSLYDDIAKSKKASLPRFQNVVHRLSHPRAPQGAHVYIVNFAMGIFPAVCAPNDLLTDEELSELGLPTAEQTTKEWDSQLDSLLNSSCVKSLTFKQRSFGQTFFPSGLVSRRKLKEIPSPNLPFEYAQDQGRFLYASLLDLQHNFLIVDPRLPAYRRRGDLPGYRDFDYHYVPFRPLQADQPRSYSPSSLKTFFGCAYSYYLAKVLKIEQDDKAFPARLGTLIHAVMEHLYKDKPFDFETAWKNALAAESVHGAWTPKEEALFLRIHDETSYLVSFYQTIDSGLDDPIFRTEDHFDIPLPGDPQVRLVGQYDKIVEFGKASRYFIIIDYKTGSERFNESLLPYGLSLQLPFYAYYALNNPQFKDEELIGLFIAPALMSQLYKKDPNESLAKFNADKFKIEGVFTNDPDKLLALDKNYQGKYTSFIRGLAYGANGFYHPTLPRIKSPEDFQAYATQAKDFVVKADQRVLSGDFLIQPLVYKGKFDACQFCQFRDVCYRPDSAQKRISKTAADDDETGDDGDEEDEL